MLFVSLIVAGLALANVKVFHETGDWAKSVVNNTLVDVTDQVVLVPAWNSSTGWVGFNISLPNQGKAGYSVHGGLIPDDGDPDPEIAMRAVNQTGLANLMFDQFTPEAWNATQVYANTGLSKANNYSVFEFLGLDNSDPYILLFRGLKNETQDRPILVSVKETWSEPTNLLDLTLFNTSVIATVAFVGLGLIAYDLGSLRKKRKRRHRQPIKKLDKNTKSLQVEKKEWCRLRDYCGLDEYMLVRWLLCFFVTLTFLQ